MKSAAPNPDRVPSSSNKSRLRNWLGKLALLAVTSTICLLLLEFCIRWFFPYFTPARQVPFVPRENGIVTGPPLTVMRSSTPKGDFDLLLHFNQYGFRDTKDLREATTNDWFALGDSFTFGWGVAEEERFSSALERLWITNGIPQRVYNIAIPDNIIGYQRLLEFAESSGARVGHLIIGVCMENDLRDYRDGHGAWDAASQQVMDRTPRKERIRAFLKKSALYNFLSFAVQRYEWGRSLAHRLGIGRSVDELTSKNEYSDVILQTSRDELLKITAGRDAVVLIIPSRRLWHGDNIETEKRVHDAFVKLLREAHVDLVDMRPVFEKATNPLDYYFKTDSHWNARGHEAAARELFATMAARQPSSQK
jgi:hypothetical protein